jgi:HEPN domain-containing protein
MHDREQARLLLVMAGKDLQALAGMTEPERFAEEIFGFHAQQATEKALKAWCCLVEVVYPRIHDLEELVGLLADAGVTVPDRFASVVDLTDYAVWARYQPFEMLGVELNREEVLQHVAGLLNHVADLLEHGQAGTTAPREEPPTSARSGSGE